MSEILSVKEMDNELIRRNAIDIHIVVTFNF